MLLNVIANDFLRIHYIKISIILMRDLVLHKFVDGAFSPRMDHRWNVSFDRYLGKFIRKIKIFGFKFMCWNEIKFVYMVVDRSKNLTVKSFYNNCRGPFMIVNRKASVIYRLEILVFKLNRMSCINFTVSKYRKCKIDFFIRRLRFENRFDIINR